MFDIEAAKRLAGIETETSKKVDFDDYPRAKCAKCANPPPEISTISTISTPPLGKNAISRQQKACCFWLYRLSPDLPGYTRMGLMTDCPIEAQRQLTKIYGKPVTGLHKKTRVNEGE